VGEKLFRLNPPQPVVPMEIMRKKSSFFRKSYFRFAKIDLCRLMVKTCQHLFSLLIYAVFVPFFSLWAEFGRKYPGVIGESGTKAQAGNLPFPLVECTDLVQLFPPDVRAWFLPLSKKAFTAARLRSLFSPNRH